VFRFAGGTHEGWSRWVDRENGNYDYLLGVDVRAQDFCGVRGHVC
jgi:alpha-amylase